MALVVDDERPPFAFVEVLGRAELTDDGDLLEWATRIGGRYMGVERVEELGRDRVAPPELLVRVRVDRGVALRDVAG